MTSIGGGQTKSPRAIYSEVCVRNLSELREQRSSGPTAMHFAASQVNRHAILSPSIHTASLPNRFTLADTASR